MPSTREAIAKTMKTLPLVLLVCGLFGVSSVQSDTRTAPANARPTAGTGQVVLRDGFLRLPAGRVNSSTQAKKYSLDGVQIDFTEVVENVDVQASLDAKAVGWVVKKPTPQTPASESYVVKVRNKSPVALDTTAYLAVVVTAVPMSKITLPPKEQDKFREVLGWAGQTIEAPFAGNTEKEFHFFKQWKLPGGFGAFNTSYFSKRFEVYLVTQPIVGK